MLNQFAAAGYHEPLGCEISEKEGILNMKYLISFFLLSFISPTLNSLAAESFQYKEQFPGVQFESAIECEKKSSKMQTGPNEYINVVAYDCMEDSYNFTSVVAYWPINDVLPENVVNLLSGYQSFMNQPFSPQNVSIKERKMGTSNSIISDFDFYMSAQNGYASQRYIYNSSHKSIVMIQAITRTSRSIADAKRGNLEKNITLK